MEEVRELRAALAESSAKQAAAVARAAAAREVVFPNLGPALVYGVAVMGFILFAMRLPMQKWVEWNRPWLDEDESLWWMEKCSAAEALTWPVCVTAFAMVVVGYMLAFLKASM